MKDNILFVITARSGSKSISDKNIKNLGDTPLIGYRIKSALSISNKNNVWVSTDSVKYSKIASKFGATIPFLRPSELSEDDSSSIDVVLHAMNYAEQNGLEKQFIGLLEPTSPFVYYSVIINATEMLEKNSHANSIVACREARPNTFFIQEDNLYLNTLAERFKNKTYLRRQDHKKQITPSGGFYISRWKDLLKNKTFYTKLTLSYKIPDECGVEIDEPIDWTYAEYILSNKIVDLEKIYKP